MQFKDFLFIKIDLASLQENITKVILNENIVS